jgi:hypothetical protein
MQAGIVVKLTCGAYRLAAAQTIQPAIAPLILMFFNVQGLYLEAVHTAVVNFQRRSITYI